MNMKSKKSVRAQVHIIIIFIITIIQVVPTILIVQPQNSGFPANKIPYSYANFGEIPFGKTHAYQLISAMTTDNQVKDLCSSQGISHLDPTNNNTYFLALNKQNCNYTQQARTAQALGASGIIIGTERVNRQQEGSVIVVDDGNGRKVHIPTLLITIQDYNKLLNLKNISLKITFQVTKKKVSQVLLFLSASGRQTYVFLRDFQKYYKILNKTINLKLIYYTIQCKGCYKQDCIMDNKFCQFDQQQYKPKVGSYIVREQFRQFNIFQKYRDKYFTYMKKFDDLCDQDWVVSEECSKNIAQSLSITQDLNQGQQSAVMDKWKKQQVAAGLLAIPQVIVNGQVFEGSVNAKQVYNMICASLQNGQVCKQQDSQDKQGRVSLTALIIILVFLFFILLILTFILYRRYFKRQLTGDMSSKVSQLVAKYATKVGQSKKKRNQKMVEKLNEEI